MLTKRIVIGGEALFRNQLSYLAENQIDVNIVNEYGPTEATVGCSVYSFGTIPDNENSKNDIPIGKPIDNVKVFILSEEKELVPIGVAGEIYISGAGLARGYLNRPDLTSEKFVPSPLDKESGERFYRTGDLGRWLPDGNIEFLGRIDEQVKIAGFRVELGEIESVLNKSELVKQAIVLLKEDKAGNKWLVSYVVPEGLFDREKMGSYLREKLPDYMIPSLWVEMENFPLTSNGKINRKVLPEPDAVALRNSDFIEPRTEEEMRLANIWKAVLNLNRVGVNDNFFELGGHSLLVMRLLSAIRKELKIEVTVRELFAHPTITDLANHISKQNDNPLLPHIGIVKDRPDQIPLSFSQERLWFVDRLEGSLPYHLTTVLRLKGELDVTALENSIRTIVNRHEILRTVIIEEDGKAFQSIREKDGWSLSVTDGLKYMKDRDALEKFIEGLTNEPFDLYRDDMLRCNLIKLTDNNYVLVVTMHHIASDAWSMPIIVREVAELYGYYTEGHAAKLKEPPLQYADYALWQRKYLQGEVLDKKIGYWKNKLGGVSPLLLPTDFRRPAVRGIRGTTRDFSIEKKLLDGIHELNREHGTTLFMTLLAVFNVLLHRYSGQNDISVGASIVNRPQQELEGLIGFFVNTLAFRSEVTDNISFAELLQQIKMTTMEAYEHQDVPFEKVVEAVVKERDPGRSPLFQAMLVLNNTPEVSQLRLGDVELSGEGFENKISKFDITFHVRETDKGIQGSVEYSTDLFKEETIDRMTGHFRELISSVIKDPDQKIGLLPMVTESEEHQVLEEFGFSEVEYPKNKSVGSF